MVVTSAEFWMGLDDDLRTEVKKALDEAVVYGNEVAAEQAAADRQAIIDSKRSEVIEITDAERQQWVDAMKPVWQKFSGDIGENLIQEALKANEG